MSLISSRLALVAGSALILGLASAVAQSDGRGGHRGGGGRPPVSPGAGRFPVGPPDAGTARVGPPAGNPQPFLPRADFRVGPPPGPAPVRSTPQVPPPRAPTAPLAQAGRNNGNGPLNPGRGGRDGGTATTAGRNDQGTRQPGRQTAQGGPAGRGNQQNGPGGRGGNQRTPPAGQARTQTKGKYYSAVLNTTLQNNRASLNPGERTAVGKLVDGQPLTPDDRQAVSDLIFSDRAGLSADEVRALSFGLIDDQARNRPASDTVVTRTTDGGERTPPPPGAVRQDRRFLRVLNRSGERVKLWLQYNAPDDQGGTWVPAEAANALQYDLAPGRAYDLHDQGARISTGRIRYWVVSPTRTWSRFATTDLVLAGPGDVADGHYLDTKVQTYILALTP